MTAQTPERRQVARLHVPWRLRGTNLHHGLGHLLDLSSQGARIERAKPLQVGRVCDVDLPPALGRATLTGVVVWTRPHKREQTYEGETRDYYQSGLSFIGLTPEQRMALAGAVEILQTSE